MTEAQHGIFADWLRGRVREMESLHRAGRVRRGWGAFRTATQVNAYNARRRALKALLHEVDPDYLQHLEGVLAALPEGQTLPVEWVGWRLQERLAQR